MVNSRNDLEELNIQFCNLIFKNGSLSEEESDRLNSVINSAVKIQIWHVPYEKITQIIYKLSDNQIDGIVHSVDEKLANIKAQSEDQKDEIDKVRSDTIRHMHLAIVQKQYIDSNLAQANKGLKHIKTIKDSIYTDFIAILGIFTAITFATFGGLQLIGNIFGKVTIFKLKNIGGALMLGAIFLLGMYLILIALLIGISKLNDKKYYLSNNSVYIITTSFLTIFTVGFIMMENLVSINILAVVLVSILILLWFLTLLRIRKKRA